MLSVPAPPRWLVAILLLGAIPLSACGGNSAEQADRVDPRKVPTAPLPATLPDPIIVSGVSERGTPTPIPAQETYQVRPGDTLGAIAARYNTTVDELMKMNNLRDAGRLDVGQTLKVPKTSTPTATPTGTPAATPIGTATPRLGTPTPTAAATATRTPTSSATGGTTYEVRPGDTAISIANLFGVSLQDLAAANDTTVPELANLRVGQQLRIPRR